MESMWIPLKNLAWEWDLTNSYCSSSLISTQEYSSFWFPYSSVCLTAMYMHKLTIKVSACRAVIPLQQGQHDYKVQVTNQKEKVIIRYSIYWGKWALLKGEQADAL